jgi:hypothetical protein
MASTKRRNSAESDANNSGQSGDNQQISDRADSNAESVEELLEEGNSFEAEAVQGVEDAEDPDVSEVVTREVPEDDVPGEYLDDDNKDVA